MLDYMTSDEVLASAYFIATEQVKYTLAMYSSRRTPIETAKVLDPANDLYDKDPEKYYQYLVDISSQPRASIGKIMMASLAIPTILFVTERVGETKRVHVMQKFFYQEFGIGSMWFDGLLYENNPNIYHQDDDKVRKKYKEHVKNSNRMNIVSDMGKGPAFRERRLQKVNSMSEADMRKILKKYYDVDTSGLPYDAVYTMIVDMYVNEDGVEGEDDIVTSIRTRYKNRRKKRK